MQKNRESIKIRITFGKILTAVGAIGVIGAIIAAYNLRNNSDILSICIACMSVAITFVAIGISIGSGARMKALTDLNFDEKMAMMAGYKKVIAGTDIENPSERLDALGSILDRCNYDLRAISHLRWWAKPEEKKKLIEEYLIGILNGAQSKDTEGKDREIICKIIKNALKVDPKNEKLKKFQQKLCSGQFLA